MEQRQIEQVEEEKRERERERELILREGLTAEERDLRLGGWGPGPSSSSVALRTAASRVTATYRLHQVRV